MTHTEIDAHSSTNTEYTSTPVDKTAVLAFLFAILQRSTLTAKNKSPQPFRASTGSDTGNGGSQNQGDNQNQATAFALTINKTGSGTASVTHNGNAVSSGTTLSEDDEVEISITPAEGQVPTATLNGSSIELTENDGVYSGNFAMPGQASSLVINTGTVSGGDGDDQVDQD